MIFEVRSSKFEVRSLKELALPIPLGIEVRTSKFEPRISNLELREAFALQESCYALYFVIMDRLLFT